MILEFLVKHRYGQVDLVPSNDGAKLVLKLMGGTRKVLRQDELAILKELGHEIKLTIETDAVLKKIGGSK